jgi:hypothetical protein
VTEIKTIPAGSGVQYRDPSGNLIAAFDSDGRSLDLPSGAALKLAGVAISATAAQLNRASEVGSAASVLQMQEVTFTQTTGDGTYTGTLALPAGARIVDLGVDGQVLWNAGTSANIIVGDDVDPDGFFTETDLNATDLLAGEINNLEHPGGKAGAYITGEQRNLYQATARNVIGVVAQVGTGTNGRTRLYVVYAVPTATAATKA